MSDLWITPAPSLIENQLSLKNAYEQAREVLIESHMQLLNVSTDLKNFATITEQQMNNLHSGIEEAKEILNLKKNYILSKEKYVEIHDTVLSLYTTASLMNPKMTYLFMSCKNNHIPSAIIDKNVHK